MRTLVTSALLLLIAAAASAEDKVNWIEDDWEKAAKEARASGKLIHANFWAEW